MASFDVIMLELRKQVNKHLRRTIPTNSINPNDAGPPFPRYALSDEMSRALNQLREQVEKDIDALMPPFTADEEAAPAIPRIDTAHPNNPHDPHMHQDAVPTNRPHETAHTENENQHPTTSEDANEALHILAPATSKYARTLVEKCLLMRESSATDHLGATPEELAKLTPQIITLLRLVATEANTCSHNMEQFNITAPALQKLKKAKNAIIQNHVPEALNLLKAALKDCPNSKNIAFLLSQTYFYKSTISSKEPLERARETAKRCCSFGENFDDHLLTFYRYRTVATERHFSAERAIELLREYYLLNPDHLIGADGFMTHDGMHLKAWIILSTIPMRYWSVYEMDSLCELAEKVEGGALFYIKFFRNAVLNRIEEDVEASARFIELEKKIALVSAMYDAVTAPLNQFSSHGTVIGGPDMFWDLRNRYAHAFISCAPIPSFDEMLLNMSLDGRRFNHYDYPSAEFELATSKGYNYWRCWAATIAPDEDLRIKGLIPFAETEHNASIWQRFEEALKVLEEEEQELIDLERWAKIQPYLSNYSYRTLLEVGMGRNNVHRQPREAHYTPLFALWSNRNTEAPLPSQIIRAHARRGSFVDIEEAYTVFEGVRRLLHHSAHGLKARMERAWELYEADTSPKKETPPTDPMKVFLALIPFIGVLSFIAVMALGPTFNALLAIFIIAAFAIIIGLVAAQNSNK